MPTNVLSRSGASQESCLFFWKQSDREAIGNAVIKHVTQAEQQAWSGIIQAPKTVNAQRTIELHPSVARLLKSFVGPRTSGYIFPYQSNFLRREFHPVLKAAGIPQAGFHGFRRYRNTFLRNVARCPSRLLKYWMGHADKDMSDLYDKVRDDPKFRRAEAKRMGVGFGFQRN